MPAIQSAEDAVAIAERLVQRYHWFRTLRKAQQEDSTWLVEFDIGVTEPRIVRVTIDVDTGNVIKYEGAGTA